ncbi:MAG: hypothetical protein LH606_13090, partial [Cytophagaceae bacterium]|nr:hypothetical protein [Cytophagaceae bacterium]
PQNPFVTPVKAARGGFLLRGYTASVWVNWPRAGLDVVRSGVPQLKPGLFRRQEGTYAQRYLQGCCTAIEFESKSRFVFRTVEGFLYFDRAVGPPAKPAATLSQSSQPRPDLATTAPPADKPISRPVETPEPTTEPEKAVSEPAKTTAISGNTTPEPTQPEAAAPSESVVKTPEPPPVLKVPEVKPKAVPALQKSLDAEQKRQAARYRTQGWLQLAAGVAGLAGGYVIHSKIKSDYAGYTTKVDALNVEYDAWRELIRTPTGSRMTPMSITQYGSPGIYAAYGAGAAGLGLSVNGVLKLMKAGRVGRNYLSKPKP